MKMIPVCEPALKGNELKYVTECVMDGWISSHGKFIQKFEESFAKFCGVKHAVACCNGTAAIHLALESHKIGSGDEVIIPSFTMIATANAVVYSGARPVLVDSEKGTWNIDPKKIGEKITPKTKAIMPVHIYGHPCDMDAINKIAKKHGLLVIEDAAEAHGAEYKGKRTGSLGDSAAFSFYSNKIISTGEGGMIVTDDKEVAQRAALLRNHAFTEPRFKHFELGFNYRMTNIQAAIGFAQMEHADELVNARIKNAHLYNKLLGKAKWINPPVCRPYAKNVYWMYGITIDESFRLSVPQIRQKLQEKGIETRSFFIPMNQQPLFAKNDPRFPDIRGTYPVADMLAKQGFYLPSGGTLTKGQIEFISDTLLGLE